MTRTTMMLRVGVGAAFLFALAGTTVLTCFQMAGLIQPGSGWHITQGVLALVAGGISWYAFIWLCPRKMEELPLTVAFGLVGFGCVGVVVDVFRAVF